MPLRRLLSSVLRDCGYRVVEISTCGQMARELQVAREAEPPIRLVVADRDLADGSAITALEEARVIGWRGPTILILPFAGPAEVEEARAVPDALVLDLPCDPDQLRAWAQELVPV